MLKAPLACLPVCLPVASECFSARVVAPLFKEAGLSGYARLLLSGLSERDTTSLRKSFEAFECREASCTRAHIRNQNALHGVPMAFATSTAGPSPSFLRPTQNSVDFGHFPAPRPPARPPQPFPYRPLPLSSSPPPPILPFPSFPPPSLPTLLPPSLPPLLSSPLVLMCSAVTDVRFEEVLLKSSGWIGFIVFCCH